jgi:phosphatidylserine/phosphatidylglycerophosphate/cardiolipin synthase-like enzyme
MMDWVLVAMGFTGAMTVHYFWKTLVHWFSTPATTRVHFSPKGGCTEAIVAELQRARWEILVQAYSFTADAITDALIAAHKRGVRVDIVLDHSNEKEPHTDLPRMLQNGLRPLIDDRHAIAHNKIMVIDGRTIITGSFNFTNQAEHENAENMLILKGQPDLAKQYQANFQVHKGHARVVDQSAKPRPETAAPHRTDAPHRRVA